MNIQDYRRGKKVLVVTALNNTFLSILKIVVGYVTLSEALIADGIHSFSDLSTDIVVLVGLKYASLPPDKNHPYGHSKIEEMASLLVGLLLLLAASAILYRGGRNIYLHKITSPSTLTIICAAISLIVKEILFRYTIHWAKIINSNSLALNAWHHRTDALSSLAVILSVGAGFINTKFYIFDLFTAVIIGVFIAKVGVEAIWASGCRLIDTSPPSHIQDKIETAISLISQVQDSHKLKMRYFGDQILVDVHILVAGDLTVREGHKIASKVKYVIKEKVAVISDVLVHLEPID